MIVANAIFGAISGSSLAATATFGRICFPEMEKAGYDAKMSLGAIAISGTLERSHPPQPDHDRLRWLAGCLRGPPLRRGGDPRDHPDAYSS